MWALGGVVVVFTDFAFADFTQASFHVQLTTSSSSLLTDLLGRSGFFHFSKLVHLSFTMVIKRSIGGESAGGEQSISGK